VSRLLLSSLWASNAAGKPDVFVASGLSLSSAGKNFQLIASGILGQASYNRGWISMTLGLGLQLAMSFVIALLYNIAFVQMPDLRQSPWMFGALYGVVIFVAMNFVVVPLSRAHPKHHWDLKSVVAMLIVMVLFAEVIACIATVFLGRA